MVKHNYNKIRYSRGTYNVHAFASRFAYSMNWTTIVPRITHNSHDLFKLFLFNLVFFSVWRFREEIQKYVIEYVAGNSRIPEFQIPNELSYWNRMWFINFNETFTRRLSQTFKKKGKRKIISIYNSCQFAIAR